MTQLLARLPARRLIGLLAAALLLFTACGDDSSSSDSTTSTSTTIAPEVDEENDAESGSEDGTDVGGEPFPASRDEFVAALGEELENSSVDGGDQSGEESACVAGALVDAVGFDLLEAENISPRQLAQGGSLISLGVEVDDAGIDRMAAALSQCLPMRQVMLDSAPPGYGCLIEESEDDVFARAMAQEFLLGASFDPMLALIDMASPSCAEEVFLATGVQRGDITTEQASCTADELEDGVAQRILAATAASTGPSPEDRAALTMAFMACGVEP